MSVVCNCVVSSGSASAGAAPGRAAGFTMSPPLLTELPDTRPDERSRRETPSAGSGQKSTSTTVRTKPPSQRDTRSSQQDSLDKGQRSQTSHTRLPSSIAPQTHVDFVSLCVRGNGLEWNLQGGNSSKANTRLESGRQKPPLLQETPVREGKQTDWSTTSCDSDTAPRLSYLGRKVEPVRPFSVSAGSADKTGEFVGLTPDVSDLTVYNHVPEKTSENSHHMRKSSDREPIPGSECERERGLCSRPQFSELRQRQQDSGFDSPFYQQK